MTLLAAFELLLSRHAGQEDVAVGTPIAGRSRAETEGLIGFFLNTLVLRTDLAGKPELPRAGGAGARGGPGRLRAPGRALREAARGAAAGARPLAHAALPGVLQHAQLPARWSSSCPGWPSRPFPPPAAGSKFDLTLYVAEGEDGVGIELVYNADLFDAARIAAMARQLEDAAAAGRGGRPDAPIDALLAGHRRRPRRVLPDPAAPLDAAIGMGPSTSASSACAGRCPERPAVDDGRESWTYGELDAAEQPAGRRLRESGVGPGDVVAIYAHRSAPWSGRSWACSRRARPSWCSTPPIRRRGWSRCLRLARPRAWLRSRRRVRCRPLVEAFLASAGWPAAWSCRRGRTCRWRSAGRRLGGAAGRRRRAGRRRPTSRSPPARRACPRGSSAATARSRTSSPGSGGTLRPRRADRFSLLSGLAHDPLQRDLFTPL